MKLVYHEVEQNEIYYMSFTEKLSKLLGTQIDFKSSMIILSYLQYNL